MNDRKQSSLEYLTCAVLHYLFKLLFKTSSTKAKSSLDARIPVFAPVMLPANASYESKEPVNACRSGVPYAKLAIVGIAASSVICDAHDTSEATLTLPSVFPPSSMQLKMDLVNSSSTDTLSSAFKAG